MSGVCDGRDPNRCALCLLIPSRLDRRCRPLCDGLNGLLGATLSFKAQSDAVLMQSVFPDPPHVLAIFAKTIQSFAVLTFIRPVISFCFIGLRGGFVKGYLTRQSGLTADTLGITMVWNSVVVPVSMIIIRLFARWAGENTSVETTAQLD